jgi:anaerobic magnesium-protoporphyrin IX monomethyl ester cyclase
MAKILLLNPSRWGRGITHIWIASHSGILKRMGHEVKLFDATFYKEWSLNEIGYQTLNQNYKPTDYESKIKINNNNLKKDLQLFIDSFEPDVIFWSAISSHIHGEGEYVNIQNGYDLIKDIEIKNSLRITSGLQAISAPEIIMKEMPKIDFLIRGESELLISQILNFIDSNKEFKNLNGLVYKDNEKIIINNPQNILKSLDEISTYDYDLFDDQVFLRPYNGELLRAVDYEISRGCIYSCNYCVETIIQKYYGFTDSSKKTGAINNFKSYLRNKSSYNIIKELEYLTNIKKIQLIRCQDTNFLTNDRKILDELADLIQEKQLNLKLYIETRPEGINSKSIELLKKLKVDGVGMGIELSDQEFRENNLNRFADQNKTIEAFKLLKKNNIKRTAYNIIGLPGQNEESIKKTIEFNKLLDPDNITVAFYSPYYGTKSQIDGKELGIFDDYEFDVDSALRSKSKDTKLISIKLLEFYKSNFVKLVKNESKIIKK